MKRVLRAIIVAEIIVAIWVAVLADHWASAAGARLGKFSEKFRSTNG